MNVQEPAAGGVAESLAGHDRGRLYLIVGDAKAGASCSRTARRIQRRRRRKRT